VVEVVDVEVVDVDVLDVVVASVVVEGAGPATTVVPSDSARRRARVAPATATATVARVEMILFVFISSGLTWVGVRTFRHSSVTAPERICLAARRTPGVLLAVEVDPLVLGRARKGDADAFAQIVGHYDHRLRALAFRLLGDRDRMDDVLQDVYVKAYRSLPKFRGASALGTWLYRITYNACVDELRHRPADDPLTDDPDPGAGPDDIAVRRRDLAAALDRLPPDQRAAVLLVDAYGLDYEDAADVLGVRTGTIGSRLSRARAALREALA